MNPTLLRLVAFLVLNFAALAIGGLFTGPGVADPAYQEATQAPWTPPGWVFGTAWTLVMLAYAWGCAVGLGRVSNKRKFLNLYGLQWGLNVLWNPLFFYWGRTGWAWVEISLLFVVVAWQFLWFRKEMRKAAWGLVPYLLWLLVANSLNGAFFVLNP